MATKAHPQNRTKHHAGNSRFKPKTKAKPLGTARIPHDSLNVDHLRFRGEKKLVADLRKLIVSGTDETTMDGASTLTFKVVDRRRKLLNSDLIMQASTVLLDNVEYTLAKVSHDGDDITLIFEESAVHWLRQYNKAKKANRSNTTRAQFIAGMVTEVKEVVIPFECPELKDKEPIAKSSTSRRRSNPWA